MFQRSLITRWIVALALAAGELACAGEKPATRRLDDPSSGGIEVVDALGAHVHLARPARRIVSLIPSATETLVGVGAKDQIVGRTRYDVAPAVRDVPSVGGGLDPSVEAILALHPDLVVAWADDERQSVRAKLLSLHIPVFVLRTEDTTDIFRGIANLGRLSGHDSTATVLAASIRDTLASVARSVAGRPAPRVMFVVYPDPPMTTGPRTFIGQLIPLAGGRSIFADTSALWPTVSMEEIVRRDPDLLIVPVGEYRDNALDRLRSLTGWRELRAVREGHVVQVPADLVNRPGPSVATTARMLRDAIHPEVVAAK